MVYKRYIKKDGKIIGPYLYKSVRQKDGTVKSIYMGQAKSKEYSNKFKITLHPATFVFVTLFVLIAMFLIFRPLISGFFIYPSPEIFSKDVSLMTNENMYYDLELNHDFFELSSFSISGSMLGDKAKVYLEFENNSYLIADISKLNTLGIAGYAVSELSDIPSESSSEQTPESINQPEEIPVSPEQINLPVPVENPIEQPVEQIPEDQPELPQAEIPSEQPIEETPADQPVETSVEQPVNEIVNETEELILEKPLEFESCKEACDLSYIGIGSTKLRLRIEVENAQLKIDKITYSIRNLKNALNIDDQSLNELRTKGSVNVILDLKESEKSLFGVQNTDAVASKLDEVTHKFSSSNDFSAELTKGELKKLLYNSQIEKVQFDMVNRILLSQSVPLINANSAWTKIDGINITGAGETACVIDTGIYDHTSLSGRIIGKHCFCSVSGPCCGNNQTESETANDDNSHGTHVAGIIASSNPTYKGVAPDANIVAVKTCDASGYCSSSDMIAGVEFCVNNSEQYNISVISISIGGGSYTDYCDSVVSAMTAAINDAKQKGIFVSIASGNSGYSNKISWPACISSATAVMSVDKSDNIPSYSNRNSLVKLAAPGGSSSNAITSTVLNNNFGGKFGTSMSTPHVSGAVILLQQFNKIYNGYLLSPSALENIFKKNGKLIYDSSNGLTFYRIDVLSSMNAILKINTTENSIESPGKAKIAFSESIDLTGYEAFSISNNFIGLDSALYPQFNKPANVTFYSLCFEKTPVILKDGIVCFNCTVLDYTNSTLLFSIPGFSNYTAGANSQLILSDSANRTVILSQEVTFYANYSSRINNEIINGSCIMNIGNSSNEMNLSSGIYSYTQLFSSESQYNYNVSCSSSDFESLTAYDSLNVTRVPSRINLTLNNKEENINILKGNSVVINAVLIQPAEGYIQLYLNDSLINEGNNSLSNTTLFSELGNFSVKATFNGTESYSPSSPVLFVNVINDSVPPRYGNIKGISAVYGKNKTYQINMTWQDEIAVGNVWIEHNFAGNFSNYSVLNNGNEYYYNWNDLAAGIYLWKMHANDSSGNLNSTYLLNLTINKSSNPVNIFINNIQGNYSTNYGTQINVTASAEGAVYLFKDGIKANNSESVLLPVKTAGYMFKANATGNANYTDNSTGISSYLFITKADSSVQLYFNNNQGDLTFTSSTSVELKAVLSTPATGNVSIYQDNSKIAEGISPLIISRNFTSGTSTINASYAGNENYSAKSRTNTITVQTQQQQQQPLQQQQPQQTEQQNQISECTPSWQCSEFSACIYGKRTRTCSDSNNCETTINKPIENVDCSCQASLKCSEWSACSNGIQTRTCEDLNKCSPVKTETTNCFNIPAPQVFELKGFAEVLGVLDDITGYAKKIRESVGTAVNKPVFYISISASAIIVLFIIFRRNVFKTVKGLKTSVNGLKKYKIKIKFEKK